MIHPINSSSAALVAQWIEQEPSNLLVAGSIPAEGALVPYVTSTDVETVDCSQSKRISVGEWFILAGSGREPQGHG